MQARNILTALQERLGERPVNLTIRFEGKTFPFILTSLCTELFLFQKQKTVILRSQFLQMESEIETQVQKKNPLRHFLPLEVPSFRSERLSVQRSVAVSLNAAPISKRTAFVRPGAFYNERQCLPNELQSQMSSGPASSYDHLVYRAWEPTFEENDQIKEAETQPDVTSRNI